MFETNNSRYEEENEQAKSQVKGYVFDMLIGRKIKGKIASKLLKKPSENTVDDTSTEDKKVSFSERADDAAFTFSFSKQNPTMDKTADIIPSSEISKSSMFSETAKGKTEEEIINGKQFQFSKDNLSAHQRSVADSTNNAVSPLMNPKTEVHSVSDNSLLSKKQFSYETADNRTTFSIKKGGNTTNGAVDDILESYKQKRVFTISENTRTVYKIGSTDKAMFAATANQLAARKKTQVYAYKKLFKTRQEQKQQEETTTFHYKQADEAKRQQAVEESKITVAKQTALEEHQERQLSSYAHKAEMRSSIKAAAEREKLNNYHFAKKTDTTKYSSFSAKSGDAAKTFASDTAKETAKNAAGEAAKGSVDWKSAAIGIAEGALTTAIDKSSADADTKDAEKNVVDSAAFIGKTVINGLLLAPTGGFSAIGIAGDAISLKQKVHERKEERDRRHGLLGLGNTNSGGTVAALLAIIIVVVVAMTIPVFTAIYPFYYSIEKIDGWIDESGNFVTEVFEGLKDFLLPTTKEEMVESPFEDNIDRYYDAMNKVVGEMNDIINTMLSPAAAADMNERMGYKLNVDAYNAAYNDYRVAWKIWFDNHRGDEPVEPDWKNYATPLPAKETPIFEGYKWADDTEGTSVPYGKFYDEMLVTLAAYNASLMTDGVPNLTYKTIEETDPITGEKVEREVVDTVTYTPPSGDIIYFTEQLVEEKYNSLPFWIFSTEEVTETCAGCQSEEVEVTIDLPDGTKKTQTIVREYCPGHITIYMKLDFDWDMTKFKENLYAGESFGEYYSMIWEQFQKDKAG